MQRRFDGSVNFQRGWDEYKEGFGVPYGEHWQGNQFAHQYTTSHPTEVILEGTAFDGVKASVKLTNFWIGDETSKYKANFDICIPVVETVNNNGCGRMDEIKNMKFSTYDMDNSISPYNCALEFSGAWWFRDCFNINLNGKYSAIAANTQLAKNIHFLNFRGFIESLKET